MASIAVAVNPQVKQKKIILELDADKFERLAATFGFFSQGFYDSLKRSEEDYKKGRIKKISSLRDLK